jgi:hypothetical protein
MLAVGFISSVAILGRHTKESREAASAKIEAAHSILRAVFRRGTRTLS